MFTYWVGSFGGYFFLRIHWGRWVFFRFMELCIHISFEVSSGLYLLMVNFYFFMLWAPHRKGINTINLIVCDRRLIEEVIVNFKTDVCDLCWGGLNISGTQAFLPSIIRFFPESWRTSVTRWGGGGPWGWYLPDHRVRDLALCDLLWDNFLSFACTFVLYETGCLLLQFCWLTGKLVLRQINFFFEITNTTYFLLPM